jgi:uridine kinase
MKSEPAGSAELLASIIEKLTPNRLPLLIAIDGADGWGKSSLASWLAWQLGMPAVQLDLYLTNLHPIRWLAGDLQRVVGRRLDRDRPVIVDGILALDALGQINRRADYHVFVKGESRTRLAPQIAEYQTRRQLPETADFIIDGYAD